MKVKAALTRALGLPLVSGELSRQSRRWRSHGARWLYLLIITVAFGFYWYAMDEQRGRGYGPGMQEMALYCFALVSWSQMILLVLGSAQTASLLLSEERNRDTLEVLLSTPLSSFAILLGKYLSVMIRSSLYVLASMPLIALLVSEGGLSGIQIFGVCVLTLCLISVATALGIFGATLNRKQNAGLGLVVAVFLLYALAVGMTELLPMMTRGASLGFVIPTLPQEIWLIINPFKAFMHIASGMGPMFSAEDWISDIGRLLLWHVGISAGLTMLLLGFTARILRPVAQMGKLTLWQAFWRSIRGAKSTEKYPPRKPWETGRPRPWLSMPLNWRALASAATPNARSRRTILLAATSIIFVFGPFFFYTGEFILRFSSYTIRELHSGRGIPPLPEKPLFEGGPYALRQIDKDIYETVYWDYERHYQTRPWRDSRDSMEFLEGWSRLWGAVLAGIAVIIMAISVAQAAAKDYEAKRISNLLGTPLSDKQIAHGLVAEGMSRLLGMFLAIPIIAIVGTVCGLFCFFATTAMLVYVFSLGTFFVGMGLRFGLRSKTTRSAQAKLGGLYASLLILWPMFVGILGGLARADEEAMFIALSPSPFFLAIWTSIGFTAISEDWPGNDHEWMVIASVLMLTAYTIIGCLVFNTVCGNVRRHCQSRP